MAETVVTLRNDQELRALFGPHDQHLRRIEQALGVTVVARGEGIKIAGGDDAAPKAKQLFEDLLVIIRCGAPIRKDDLDYAIKATLQPHMIQLRQIYSERIEVPSRRRFIIPRTPGQKEYVEAMRNHDVVFAIGPAGTGKSYLAVAMAVERLTKGEVSRIILTRPAVEAGERLGYLPGDVQEKINPYLRPLYDALYEMMEVDAIQRYIDRGIIEVAPLAFMRGRAQPDSSRVLTADGWREIGQLRVGDEVIGSDGRPTKVVGVYPQGEKEVFRVTATDRSSTLCCGDHLWTVWTLDDKKHGTGPRVLSTRDMVGRLRRHHQHRFELPVLSGPVQFPWRPVPLDPYALGLLLGDGCLTGRTPPMFATRDLELVSSLENGLGPAIEVRRKGDVDYVLRHVNGGRGGLRIANPVTVVLRELGLCGTRSDTKFVPEPYLYNAPEIRLAVLQGLLDTDGGPVTQEGRTCRVHYTTTSKELRDDVMFLVRSLGGVAYARVRTSGSLRPGRARGRPIIGRTDAHVIDIRLPCAMAPFRLSRKVEKHDATGGGRPMRHVADIQPEGCAKTRCIRVAAADSLYVTDDFLLTHNTLNDAFIILDEAQNSTSEQMKMFLTRLGFDSKAVITGDVTQVDLPPERMSGLIHVQEILRSVEGLKFVSFNGQDVVRHELVQEIIRAYDQAERNNHGRGERRP